MSQQRTGNINKNQMEMLDLKYIITEIKNSVDGLKSRMEGTEEIITIIINRGWEESFIGDGCVYGVDCDGFMVNMYPKLIKLYVLDVYSLWFVNHSSIKVVSGKEINEIKHKSDCSNINKYTASL